ncbi:MAG: signal recognition particle-docking protein FtsY [Alphaproteobacteria bacterium]|nr:signal recognition particle-docking protein FtsY [Alphaproteobacteria bacterium]
MGILDKLKKTFKKTSESILTAIVGKKIDEDFYQEIEDALIRADVGAQTSIMLAKKLADKKFPRDATESEIKKFLADEITRLLEPYEANLFDSIDKSTRRNPEIILVIGVNGNGKTTSIAKLANVFKKKGHNPLMIAGDTFRAAAVEQLKYWGNQLGIAVFHGKDQADAAGVVYSGIEKAKSENNDIVLIDTAGRMQNRDDLIAELDKIKRVIKKIDGTAPHKTILVLDGLTGQTAHLQVESFLNKVGIDGLIVTKLDSTAKGGAVISLTQKYKAPIFAIGVGEGADDLQPFSANQYAKAILDE